MKILLIPFLIALLTSSFADEDPCFCGIVSSDPDYARAVYLLNLSIQMNAFHIGVHFPTAASEFYPSLELRESDDDPYPYTGHISWNANQKCSWITDLIFKNDIDYGNYLNPQEKVEVPSKIIRELTNYPNEEYGVERFEKKAFVFRKNYGAIPQAFRILKNDISQYFESNEIFLVTRIQDVINKIPVYEWGGMQEKLTSKKKLLRLKKQTGELYYERMRFVEEKELAAFDACKRSLDWCIENHHSPSAHFNRGLFDYLQGNTVDALTHVEAALDKSLSNNLEKLRDAATFLKGQTEIEAGLYADAVITLTQLINRNPSNKEAFLERASAYFELSDFDLSLEDYLKSEIKPFEISSDPLKMLPFSLGLTKGILQGGVQSSIEFVPSLLSSLQGLSQGLWAFAEDPVQVSTAFIESSEACLDFIRNHTTQDTLVELVPELRELIEKWDTLPDENRGEITGTIIGKYGVDIFAGIGLTKAMNSYRQLKRANNILTFEAMALSERNKSILKIEALKKSQIRQELLQSANLQIQWDKQGKHIINHRNYDPILKKSIFEHSDPNELIKKYAGTGLKTNDRIPGSPGFQELINFEQFIGFAIDEISGEKIATNWGKIHYAKDGVHIVPTKPRLNNKAVHGK